MFAESRLEVELDRDLLLSTPPRRQRKRTNGQMKAWLATLREGLEPQSGLPVSGYAQ